jgi:hypothetical protein
MDKRPLCIRHSPRYWRVNKRRSIISRTLEENSPKIKMLTIKQKRQNHLYVFETGLLLQAEIQFIIIRLNIGLLFQNKALFCISECYSYQQHILFKELSLSICFLLCFWSVLIFNPTVNVYSYYYPSI